MAKRLRTDRELSQRGGHGIDRKLTHMGNTASVFWSEGGNSYVAVQLTEPTRLYGTISQPGFQVVSINGIGEIRWAYELDTAWMPEEGKEAVDYFFEDEEENPNAGIERQLAAVAKLRRDNLAYQAKCLALYARKLADIAKTGEVKVGRQQPMTYPFDSPSGLDSINHYLDAAATVVADARHAFPRKARS